MWRDVWMYGIRCSQRRGFLRDNPLRGEVRPVVHAPVARQIGGKFDPRDVRELDGTAGDQLLRRQGGIRRGWGRSPLGNPLIQSKQQSMEGWDSHNSSSTHSVGCWTLWRARAEMYQGHGVSL